MSPTTLSSDLADRLLPEAARKKALARSPRHALLSRIYAVPAGWEAAELANLPGLRLIESADALSAALEEKDTLEIFIRATAGFTPDTLEKTLATHPYPKTFFIETV